MKKLALVTSVLLSVAIVNTSLADCMDASGQSIECTNDTSEPAQCLDALGVAVECVSVEGNPLNGDNDDLIILSTEDSQGGETNPLGTLNNGASNETIGHDSTDFGNDTVMNFTTPDPQ